MNFMTCKAYMPARPGFGQRGKKITLISNFFEINCVPSADVIQYDVQISPLSQRSFIQQQKRLPRDVNRVVMKKLYETYKREMFNGVRPAFDGVASFYMPKRLPFETRTEKVELAEKHGEFIVKITESAVVNMASLAAFLAGAKVDNPQSCVHCLDIIMRSVPAVTMTMVGSSFFSGQRREALGPGAEVWLGYHQSVRPGAKKRMLVNIDTAASVFMKAQPLQDFVQQVLELEDLRHVTTARHRNRIRAEVVGVKVRATHRKHLRSYRIWDVAKETPTQFKFEVENEDGSKTKTTVAEFFLRTYKVKLRYPNLPLVVVGSRTRPLHMPIEVCHIISGERIKKQLSPAQTAAMIKITAQKPQGRMQSIRKMVAERAYDADQTMSDFGVKVNKTMVAVNGRVLTPPVIVYNKNATVNPKMGVWQPSRNMAKFQARPLQKWGVLNLENRCGDRDLQEFIKVLIGCGSEYGFPISMPALARTSGGRNASYQDLVMQAVQSVKKQTGGHIQLLLVVLPGNDSSAYGEVKRVCDTVVDVPSQCMLSKNIRKKNAMYCHNILLKMNVKLGGINSVIDSRQSQSHQLLFRTPAIVFGCDVTHPMPGSKQASIAALVGSMDAYPYRFETEIRSQESRKEVVSELKAMAKALLIRFYQATRHKPAKILFYRDGVSEGQFDQVLKYELTALRAACAELEANYAPTITFVIVQKRHHARFFCKNPKDTDRSGNVPPGTIVDTDVIHPTQFDFYLVSHAGIQGTSRPTHYHCIWDENNFSADALQDLTNRMCYMYARCSRAVSLVPAVYYAHLAAFRARYHARADEFDLSSSSASEKESNTVVPLPRIKEQNRKIMYFM